VDPVGNLFIAELVNARVRRVGRDGIIHTVVGGGRTSLIPVAGMPATEARLGDAQSLAFDGAGNLFVAGLLSSRVWKVSPEGWITTIYRGGQPFGVAADATGNLFFMDFDTQRVRKVTPDGTLSTIAGGGTKLPRTADGGPATEARLNGAAELAVDTAGNLFISERHGYRVRKVTPEGIISTVAGNGQRGFSGDGGPATQARLKEPLGLAVDSAGNLFIADRGDYRVRKVTPEGIISTVAGNGKAGLSGVGGPATEAGLRCPNGLAVDAAGNLYIGDSSWIEEYHNYSGRARPNEQVVVVVGIAAPGLIAGKPFPQP
jgi:DNA-binding beta-propeller fold protein YncE